MLIELHIQNFALIDDLRFEVGPGLNVLTGETGAGKSIIVDAMSAALGERTGSEMVRTGSDKALVEAVFDVCGNQAAVDLAGGYGFEPEEGLLILSREIAKGGRSTSRVNGRATTAAVQKEITGRMIDIHGQHEHQSLLMVPIHIDILDGWIGMGVMALRDEAQVLYSELTDVISERNKLQTDERERARMLDLYQFQADEIGAANLQPGEEEEIANERNRLANAEKLYAAASEIHDALARDGAAIDSLSSASVSAERMTKFDQSIEGFVETVTQALINAQEALAIIRDYRESVEANPAKLEQVEERLDAIRLLKRKYGDTIEEIIKYGDELTAKIDNLVNSESRSQELDGRIDDLKAKLDAVCGKLTAARKKSAPEFEKNVERELADLAMGKTRFEVSITASTPGPRGADSVEFLISPNPGEPVKPLVKIASGGEMSRIMLALKSVTKNAEVPTLVFDEIDTGIGGRTAQVLGDKLASISGKYQVMCVTHLAQIASKAATHFTVEKVVEGGRSFVRLRTLEGEDRVLELARMLGGEETSAAAAQHAREMLGIADQRVS